MHNRSPARILPALAKRWEAMGKRSDEYECSDANLNNR
jgi:hypothetical protein